MVNTTLEAIDTTQQTVDITQETVVITQETPLSTVIQYLAKHSSVIDLTDELSRSLSVSPCAVARGGFSDIYRATLPNGTQLAIKCLRQHDPKHVKVWPTPVYY
ncbi:hypothetical protein FRC10_010264 [Ceratobasidium sp. 414]|nr:hypothetical protein FRC10_010264 [Ceratobasidium sp. 414]